MKRPNIRTHHLALAVIAFAGIGCAADPPRQTDGGPIGGAGGGGSGGQRRRAPGPAGSLPVPPGPGDLPPPPARPAI